LGRHHTGQADPFEQLAQAIALDAGKTGSDAAVVRVRETGGGLALSCDCNSRWVELDPYLGAQHAVAEAARNLAASGARAIGASDCLNFGSPEKPEVMYQFTRAIDGIAEACKVFEAPVVSGNVSFYNDTRGRSIPPTPVIAMVGLMDDAAKSARVGFGARGQGVWLLGHNESGLGTTLSGSEYLAWRHALSGDRPPDIDLAHQRAVCDLLVSLISDHGLRSAHDLSDGGFAVALAEMAFAAGFGADVDLAESGVGESERDDVALFGEGGARFLVAVDDDLDQHINDIVRGRGIAAARLGSTGDGRVVIRRGARVVVDASLDSLKAPWRQGLGAIAGDNNKDDDDK